MKTRPYWVQPKNNYNQHKQRFLKSVKTCWCIDLDQHDLGYQMVNEEEWMASLHPSGDMGVGIPHDEWEDPRRGDLFALVDSLKSQREDGAE